MNKLYLLRQINPEAVPFNAYDTNQGFVIRAKDENHAREIAAAQHGDEGSAVWYDYAKTSCEVLSGKGPTGVVMCDFKVG
jgi:hypothetical protein